MNFTQLLNRNVALYPDAIATCYLQRSFTYKQLSKRVARLAAGLQKLGVKPGVCVAQLSMNSDRYLEYLFAVPWAGGHYNLVNVRWSVDEMAYAINDSKASVLFVDDVFCGSVDEIKSQAPNLQHIVFTGEKQCPDGMIAYEQLLENDPVDDAYRHGDDLLGIFYTGGTTGKPKGVMSSHANMMCFPLMGVLMGGIRLRGTMLNCAPLFHIAGLGILLMGLLQADTHVFIPGFDPDGVIDAVKQHKVTDMLLVPTMLQMLLDAPNFKTSDFSTLEHIIYGASPMPLGTMDKSFELLPHVGLVQGYGMTECGLITMSGADNHTLETRESGRIRSAGLPGPVQEVRIVDTAGNEVPRGQVGEVTLRGANVMMGYWQQQELTDKTIIDGWLHTGDGGYMDDDGYVFIVDRVKDMIISGGENIYSSEVETILSQHPDIGQCAVIGIPSEQWGETVHAIVVASPECDDVSALTIENVRDFCKQRLSSYKCPRSLDVVSALPISGAGKILKTELRKPFWQNKDQQVS